MKKSLYIVVLLFVVSITNAQSIESVRMAFTQTLAPKKVLPAHIKNYNCTITTPYLKDDSSFRQIAEEKYQADLKNYPNTIKEAQKHYDEVVLKEHEIKVAEAKEKYRLESDEFNKMSKLEKLALIDKRPVLRIPEKPAFNMPPQPRVENINTNDIIIFNPETLSKNYIKLNGFGDGNDGLQININFKGFEYIEPVASIVDVENYNAQTKQKFYTKQTQFVTKYRHPTTLQIKIGSEELMSGVFEETGAYQTLTSSSKPTRIYIERQEVEKILSRINSFLNANYGYPQVTRNVVLFYVKNKKGEYDDVEKAKDFAISGYKNYTTNQTEAEKDIENAIQIWEKTLSEANFEDSKARIDEKVGTALIKNLIFATIITNDFNKAEKYIGELKKLRLSYDDKQFLEYHESIYSDLKSRFSAK